MSRSVFASLALVACAAALPSASATASDTAATAADAAVRKPVEQYLQAHATGNGDLIRQAFVDTARIESVRDAALRSLTREEFAARFSGKPAEDESRRKRAIRSVEVHGTVAVAVVELDYPTVHFFDVLTLLQVGGEWRIVYKAFDAAAAVAAPSRP
jgi:hypothetical protein